MERLFLTMIKVRLIFIVGFVFFALYFINLFSKPVTIICNGNSEVGCSIKKSFIGEK